MPGRFRNPLKSDLKNQFRVHTTDRPKSLFCILPHPLSDLFKFGVRKARISFRKWYQSIPILHRKSEICKQVSPPPMSSLRIDHHCVNRQRIDLPLPPITPFTALDILSTFPALQPRPPRYQMPLLLKASIAPMQSLRSLIVIVTFFPSADDPEYLPHRILADHTP